MTSVMGSVPPGGHSWAVHGMDMGVVVIGTWDGSPISSAGTTVGGSVGLDTTASIAALRLKPFTVSKRRFATWFATTVSASHAIEITWNKSGWVSENDVG